MSLSLAGKLFLSGLGLYTAGSLYDRWKRKQTNARNQAEAAQQQYEEALRMAAQAELDYQQEPYWVTRLKEEEAAAAERPPLGDTSMWRESGDKSK